MLDHAKPCAPAHPSGNPPRHLVVVDVETTGLDPAVHVPVEVAWRCLTCARHGEFLPRHTTGDLERAEPEALEINQYAARRLGDRSRWDNGDLAAQLHEHLVGATLCGSNPRFDAAMLAGLFCRAAVEPEPWHHRLFDLASYAAGVLALEQPPGLADVCAALLGVPAPDHSAAGDVAATAACFLALQARAQDQAAAGAR